MRQSYGDLAVEYVQLLHKGSFCTVVGKICPEHKVQQKDYVVEVLVNEETVLKAKCQDCAASKGKLN